MMMVMMMTSSFCTILTQKDKHTSDYDIIHNHFYKAAAVVDEKSVQYCLLYNGTQRNIKYSLSATILHPLQTIAPMAQQIAKKKHS